MCVYDGESLIFYIICSHFYKGEKIVDDILKSLLADGYKISPLEKKMYH